MKWLAIDPGDMLGWSVWEDAEYIGGGQTPNWQFVDDLDIALNPNYLGAAGSSSRVIFVGVERLVVEDFRLYPWRLKDLAWDGVETARIIGALALLARQRALQFVLQPASIKETAVAGGAEEFFVHPLHENRHQNDSIMHGTFYVQTVLLNPSNARVEGGRLVPMGERRDK